MAFTVHRRPLIPLLRFAGGIDPTIRVIPDGHLLTVRTAVQIVEDANSQAESIISAARTEFAKERIRGFEEGLDEARRSAAEKMMEAVARTNAYFHTVENQIIELVMDVLRKLIFDFSDRERVLIVVRNALSVMRNQKQITLRVNNQQVSWVKTKINEIISDFPCVGYVDVVADDCLAQDACIAESDIGVVEACLEVQINALSSALQKCFHERAQESTGASVGV